MVYGIEHALAQQVAPRTGARFRGNSARELRSFLGTLARVVHLGLLQQHLDGEG